MTVTDSTFSGNSASSIGGAILNGGTLILTGSTLFNNSAEYGGGIFTEGTETGLTSTAQSLTTRLTYGGGINATAAAR